jgi:hypothetical protein
LNTILTAIFFFLSVNLAFSDSTDIFDRWNALDKKIASKKISKKKAAVLLEKYSAEVSLYYFKCAKNRTYEKEWVFPLKDYSSISYYKNGDDYNDSDYDYFDGNESWNHPANDICIADTNKDCLDDVTGNPVSVVSMSAGIVIATDSSWEPGSIFRAGKYIRIFDPSNYFLLYYSHLNSVYKKPGDIVKPGDKIGEVGRTGRSMVLSVGQTHLHIALLEIIDGCPEPRPLLDILKRTEKNNK